MAGPLGRGCVPHVRVVPVCAAQLHDHEPFDARVREPVSSVEVVPHILSPVSVGAMASANTVLLSVPHEAGAGLP